MQKLKIDEEFQNLIPPLSPEEFKQLKENIIADGCREPLVVWNGIIVDGHNRYKICSESNISFKTEDKAFSDRSAVVEWMLRNQLGRRNLNDFQRNEVALKYEQIIAEQMKQRQSEAGGDKVSKKCETAVDQMNHSAQEKTSKRKELAKIAGTSEGSIQRSKLILEKGTPEQISRAREGGAGNTVSAIANEIKNADKPKDAPQKPKKSKNNFMPYDLTDESRIEPTTIDELIQTFNVNFYRYLETLKGIIDADKHLLEDAENNKKMAVVLSEAVTAMHELKGDYIHD